MSGANVLDIILVLALIGYAVSGYRTGLVAGALSLAGFLGGGFLALWLLPGLFRQWSFTSGHDVLQAIALVVGTFVVAAFGQGVGLAIGSRLRSLVRSRPARTLDSVLGLAASVVVVAALVWFVAGAARGALPTPAARAISGSRVLQTIDRVMPPEAGRLFAGVQEVLDRHGFPRVFTGVRAEPIRPVAPPDPGVVQGRGIAAAASSIVKVTGVASACDRGQEGSGWVAAHDRVVTNAHVVAGVPHPMVRVGGVGQSYPATVVLFDPERDIAVLAVPGLPARPLPTGGGLTHGDSAVVAGFPLNGPYELDAARVRATIDARGADIYGNPGVERQVYSLNARVQPGNSGGPLLSPSGQVVGTVFAKSLDDPHTGYALTLAETRPVLVKAAAATQPVSTGSCTELAGH
ncbi:MAG TPA: MarP family serine protease [Segeticoccus sp.]|uniref:MarP family serine protease n=1 Tax=Segeticoccus sp. TaxID=2706531 RepID=UPI002D7E32D0|nr:MarP family serine protease [Segeticoccus sp.]HET8599012.1 MarP family serine protease [Segeticoccus sp.]